GLDHWQRRVGFADARGMEPGEKAFGTGCTRASIAFRAAGGLLFAAPRTPGEDQWREWHGKRRERAIGLERQPGFDSCLHVQWIDPTSQSIGAGRNFGESLLDSSAPRV